MLRSTQVTGQIAATGVLTLFLAACSADLVSQSDTTKFENPKGVPWVESREYDVYVVVYDGTTAKPLHYGRYALGDKVNGQVIDENRPRWTANYRADLFSDAGLTLSFHENGSLKDAKISTKPGTADALTAGTELLDVTTEIEKRELERLQRERAIRDAREALDEGNDP